MGARTVSGPPPDPNSRRQQTKAQASGWIDLPAGGREGDAPAWPFRECAPGEIEAWEELWRSPQAVAWEALAVSTRDVATYVRFSILGELDAKAANEARQWSDRLGLNPAAMLRNHWRIKGDDLEQKRTERAKPAKRRTLKVADSAVGS